MPTSTKSKAKKPAPTKAAGAVKAPATVPAKTPVKAAVAVKASAKTSVKAAATKAKAPVPPVPKAEPSIARPIVSSEQRRHYVEVAAYYIAERHGFMPGRHLADWAAAEAEIDRLLAAGRLNP